MKKFKKIRNELQEKLGYNGNYQRKSKHDGKQFNRQGELKLIAKIRKLLEQADKLHADLQYPNTVDTVTHVWEHINNAHIGLMKYEGHIKQGKYDGEIDIDS